MELNKEEGAPRGGAAQRENLTAGSKEVFSFSDLRPSMTAI